MIELWLDDLIRISAAHGSYSQEHWLTMSQYTRTVWLALKTATCMQSYFWYETY